MLSQKLDREYKLTAAAKELKDASADISRVAEELQATVMSIRMIPISTVFQRFSRLVRDLARGMEKEIEISFQGEDTELDKTVIQIIGDPLVHLVRNAADHGIETRSQAGTGQIASWAYPLTGLSGKQSCGN